MSFISMPESEDNLNKVLNEKFGGIKYPDLKIEMRQSESNFLLTLLDKYSPKKILEVGVSAGGTSALILKNIDKAQSLYSVDISKAWYKDKNKLTGFIVDEFCAKEEKENFYRYTGSDIVSVVEKIGEGIDFVILDTSHVLPGELLSFVAIMPFLNDVSVIVLHDLSHNASPFTPQRFMLATKAYCSRVLFNAIYSLDKYVLKTARSNIGAVVMDKSYSYDYTVYTVFSSLFYTWHRYPERTLSLYPAFIKKYYTEDYFNTFNEILKFQKNIVNFYNDYIKNIYPDKK